MKEIVAVALGVAVLAGCGSTDEPTAADTATPAATATEQNFGTVDDLRAAIEATGYICDGWELVADPVSALERATCSDEVVLSVYTDADQVQTAIDEFIEGPGAMAAELEVELESVWLVGDTWSINCGEDMNLCAKFGRALGGEIQTLVPEVDEGQDYYVPTADDFELAIKILEKKCFGSAGCNVTFRVDLTYLGWEDLDPNVTYELTYEIQGGEDVLINTLEVTGDEYSRDESEQMGTASSDDELTAVVIDVTEY